MAMLEFLPRSLFCSQYYETLLQEAKEKREKCISEAVEKTVNLKLQDIQIKLENVIREKKVVAEVSLFHSFFYVYWVIHILLLQELVSYVSIDFT